MSYNRKLYYYLYKKYNNLHGTITKYRKSYNYIIYKILEAANLKTNYHINLGVMRFTIVLDSILGK